MDPGSPGIARNPSGRHRSHPACLLPWPDGGFDLAALPQLRVQRIHKLPARRDIKKSHRSNYDEFKVRDPDDKNNLTFRLNPPSVALNSSPQALHDDDISNIIQRRGSNRVTLV